MRHDNTKFTYTNVVMRYFLPFMGVLKIKVERQQEIKEKSDRKPNHTHLQIPRHLGRFRIFG